MAMVKVVLVLLAAGCFYLAYTYISVLPSERAKARRFRSLEEAGIETQARLVSLSPYPGDARGLAVLELVTPAGETIRAKYSVRITPEMRVGGPYPVVRHRQFPDRFEPGDLADMARIRRHHGDAPRAAWRWAASAIVIGVVLALSTSLI